MMPVGIQMFATITSKDHVRHIQQDLQNMYFSDMYRDTILHCSDGSIYLSRLLTGLLFPSLKQSRCFQMLEEATLMLPEYNKLEIEKSIFNLLGIKYCDESQDHNTLPVPAEWPKEIDKIIGTLHPTSPVKGYRNATKAVLHSAMTQETAVIHAASTDDERDDLRIVDGGEIESEDWRPTQDDGRKIHKKLKLQHYQQQQQQQQNSKKKQENHVPSKAVVSAVVDNLQHQLGSVDAPVIANQQLLDTVQQQQLIDASATSNQHYNIQTSDLITPTGEALVLPTSGFLCTLCNSLFEDQKQFDLHIRQSHSLYKCKRCEATFKRQRDLLDHGRLHSGHKLIRCHICDKDFTERGLLWHTERFHKVEIATTPKILSEDTKPKANSLQDTLDSSKPMKKRGLKSDITDAANSNPPEQIRPGPKENEVTITSQSSSSSPEKHKNSAKRLKGELKEKVYQGNNVYFSSSDSEPDGGGDGAGSVSERVKRKKTRSRHEEHCEKCGEAIPRRSIADHRKNCLGTAKTGANTAESTENGCEDEALSMRITRNNSGTAAGSRSSGQGTDNSSGQGPASSGGQGPNSSGGQGPTSSGGQRLNNSVSPQIEATTHIIITPEKQLSGAISANLRGSITPLTDTASIPGVSGINNITPDASGGSEATGSGTASGGGKKSNLRKLFACSYCHKKFSYNSSMRVHEKVHLGGKPYHCDMCDAKFSNKFDLYAHEKEHSDQRPHKCSMCQETFKTEENLRFHKMIHSASEPITCKYCNKYFQTKHQLTEHEKVHTGPFKCNQCGISYDKATKLSSHMKSKHPK